MTAKMRAVVGNHPHLAALGLSLALQSACIGHAPHNGRDAVLFSGLLVGFIVGAHRVQTWRDVLKTFPGALACFVLACWIATCVQYLTRRVDADMEGLGLIIATFIALLLSPGVLIGEVLGWRARPWIAPSASAEGASRRAGPGA